MRAPAIDAIGPAARNPKQPKAKRVTCAVIGVSAARLGHIYKGLVSLAVIFMMDWPRPAGICAVAAFASAGFGARSFLRLRCGHACLHTRSMIGCAHPR